MDEQPGLSAVRSASNPLAVPRSALRLLGTRSVGALFWGKVGTAFGMWAFTMTVAIAVFDATGSALAVGMAGAALFLPQLILAPVSGSWADRCDTKRLILIGALCAFVASLGITLWTVAFQSEGWIFAWVVVAWSALVGTGLILGNPAQQAALPRMVSAEELPAAISLNFTPMTVARIAGPLAGATLVTTVGTSLSLGFTAGCQLFAFVCFLLIRLDRAEPGPRRTDYSVRRGFRYLLSDKPLVLMMVVAIVISFGAEPSLTLAPALAREFNAGPEFAGILTATFGLGGAIGLALGHWMGARGLVHWGAVVALGLQTIGLLASAFSPSAALTLGGFGLAGVGFSAAITTMAAGIVLRVPSAFRGRIMSFWLMASLGFRPLAGLLVGVVTDFASVRLAVAAMAAIVAITIIFVRPSRLQAPVPADVLIPEKR